MWVSPGRPSLIAASLDQFENVTAHGGMKITTAIRGLTFNNSRVLDINIY
jgi:hypothetical protein